ncbi:MAG: methylmalonyl-CoA epimerase [Ferrimicrobium sp.]
MNLTEVDHIAIAVRDLDAAIATWELVGARLVHREIIESDGVDEALLAIADSFLQLVSPVSSDSTVTRFLERRGEGLHHLGLRVPNCQAAIDELDSQGIRMIDTTARAGSRGTTVAFIHPSAVNGTLVELVEEPSKG